MRITYTTYSPVLKKTFTDSGEFETMADFRLFAYALFSGNWSIVSVNHGSLGGSPQPT